MLASIASLRPLVSRALVSSAGALLAALATADVAAAQVTYLTATLNGAQEVPPNGSPGTGFGHFRLDQGAGTLAYYIEFSGLSSAETAAHIHGFAGPGVNAPVLFPLPAGSPKSGSVGVTPAQATNILAGLTYVNIHTATLPGGEIRGQILQGATEYYLTTSLSGLNEVPPTPSPATGSGCMVFNPATGNLDYNISFSGLTSAETAAHFHSGAAGVNGPVLFALPPGSPKIGTIVVPLNHVQRFLTGGIYTNVHTSNFPGGEIRGQLLQATPHVEICFGDAGCPCANNSVPGQGGCLNSIGQSAELEASGFASLVCDTLQLDGSQMFTSTAIYIQGNTEVAPTTFGDGLRCFGGTLRRLAVVANSGGASTCPPAGQMISVLGQIAAPGTYVYGVYYRDPDIAFCPTQTFNTANSVRVVWAP